MSKEQQELDDLKSRIASLTARVYALEKKTGIAPVTAATPAVTAPVATAAVAAQAAAPPPISPVVAATAAGGGAKPPQQDLESKLGAVVLNRIAIIAMLVAVSYGLKLAFENNWVGPAGRVAIGLLV